MPKLYRTAQGRTVDIAAIMTQNERTRAVGNMKVNARGDELGSGGQVVRTRNQVMDDYYRLNTPMATDSAPIQADNRPAVTMTPMIMPEAVEAAQPVTPAEAAKLKGNLASTFAKK